METQKQIDYSGDLFYLRNLIESLRMDVNKQTKITTDKLSDLKIENTTVYLSPPDSTGKQYHIKESTTTASKKDQERTEVDETLSITLERFSNRLDSLSGKVDAMLNQKDWGDLLAQKGVKYYFHFFFYLTGLAPLLLLFAFHYSVPQR